MWQKRWESRVLAEEFLILNGTDALWQTARPLLDVALHLEQQDDTYSWHGWQKAPIQAFLAALPSPCSLVVGVWDTFPATSTQPAQDKLVLGVVCDVAQGTVRALHTFEALVTVGLKSVDELEISMEDALEIMHYARRQVAPVAWALFIEKTAWDEWLFTDTEDGWTMDKGALLDTFANKGRCVLMGSQATLHEQDESVRRLQRQSS